MVLRALHLCSGYGGFELALRLAGVPARTVAHVERDAYAAATLVARMEEAHLDQAPVWSDLTTFDGAAWRGRVDLITAGFPCQPFSAAGQQRGVDDERWLWPAIGRLIGEVGPRFVFLENVPQLVRLGLPHVLSDLAQLGFDAEWGLFSAAEVGAPHRRERFWLLAHAAGSRPQGSNRPRGIRLARSVGGDVGHAGGSGRPEVPRSTLGDEATCAGPHTGCCDHVADGAGQAVADPNGARPEGSRCATVAAGPQQPHAPGGGLPAQWPPGRDDIDGWTRWTAEGGPEPAVRRGADGRPAELADALHLGGNGLVPVVAAAALVELARRLDIDMNELTNERNL